MEFPQLVDVLHLHRRIVALTGGATGLRDRRGLESALAQPRMTFGGVDLYPEITDKGASLCFSLVCNHPFIDGNKRIGYATMRLFLDLNDRTIDAAVDDAEQTMLALAAGQLSRPDFTAWVKAHAVPLKRSS